jgi:hypothetical protein
MVIRDAATFPGLVVTCRVIGILQIEESKKKSERNDRLFAVPRRSHSEQALKDVDDLTKPIGEELAISPSTQSCACKSQRQSLALSESRIEPTTSPFKSTIARVEKRKGKVQVCPCS